MTSVPPPLPKKLIKTKVNSYTFVHFHAQLNTTERISLLTNFPAGYSHKLLCPFGNVAPGWEVNLQYKHI